MKNMTRKEKIAFNKSYHAYVRDWYNWKNKGWAMKSKTPMNRENYYELFTQAKDAKLKNIGSNFAASDRILDTEGAKSIYNVLKQIPKGTDEGFDKDIKKFSSLSKIKRNIGDYKTIIDDTTYYGKQAIFLDIKFIFGLSAANEYYGY